MEGLSELGGLLHEEHFRIVVWLSDLINHAATAICQPSERCGHLDRTRLLHQLIAAVDEFRQHEAFEEGTLFPLLAHHHEPEIVNYLHKEHMTIGPVVIRLRSLAVDHLHQRWDTQLCAMFSRTANELCANLIEHLAREEEVIVRRLRSLLDHETDGLLA